MSEVKIDPRQLIQELSVEELCETAETYYAAITDPIPQMAKPFSNTLDAPHLLYSMGMLLSGMRLGKSMTVLDFGAGTCWFSRCLNQMQCVTISIDPSASALEMGRRLFEMQPILGGTLQPPRFVLFDGYTIDVADESVDRIVCFDVFHHIPNQEQVLREFYRVLKPGGIIGFNEPGQTHSQTAQSQYEMRNFKVLENDIHLDEIKALAEGIGFGELRIKLLLTPDFEMSYADYVRTTKWRLPPSAARHNAVAATRNGTVFFFTKGTYINDSRSHTGLSHRLEVLSYDKSVTKGRPCNIVVRAYNTGSGRWLHENVGDIGVVKAGVHLYKADGTLLDLDFGRGVLQSDVMPGDSAEIPISVTFTEPGEYKLEIDMVSEAIIWFGLLDSETQTIQITVT